MTARGHEVRPGCQHTVHSNITFCGQHIIVSCASGRRVLKRLQQCPPARAVLQLHHVHKADVAGAQLLQAAELRQPQPTSLLIRCLQRRPRLLLQCALRWRQHLANYTLSSCTSRVASLSGAAIMARRSSSCGVGTCHKMHHRVAIDSGGLPMETPRTMRHSRCTQRSFSRALLAQECAVQGGPLMKTTDSTHDALFYIL